MMRLNHWLITAASLCVLVFALIGCRSTLPSRPGPAWDLKDQDGAAFGSANLRGKVALVTFVYTNCPTVCPTLTAQMRRLQDEFKRDGTFSQRVAFVSMTVDPKRDTPEKLKAYATQFGVDFAGWTWITGGQAQLEPIWQAYGVVAYLDLTSLKADASDSAHSHHDASSAAKFNPDVYEVTHTVKTILLDKHGNIRAEYKGTELPRERVLQDVAALLVEGS
jgi:protein SCO1/2